MQITFAELLYKKEEAIIWLKDTRESLHKEFANHGINLTTEVI
jgi:hypothetical protein